jgi:cytochrome c oxidase subunit 2
VGKGWSIFFGAVLAATFLIWLAAPSMGWWLPPNVASFGGEVDYLFYVILGFTGFFFVLTEALMIYAMWKFAYRPGHKSDYVEGNHRLEILWTIVPAGILLFIAIAQINAWEKIKYVTRMPHPDQVVQVNGRQWEWRLRYPAHTERFAVAKKKKETAAEQAQRKEAEANKQAEARRWAELPEFDDLHVTNELHTWKGAHVKIYLKTVDVLHSFGIPNLRLMQDALPGKTIPMWFKVTEANARFENGKTVLIDPSLEWEIACKELCGNGHYRMRGLLYVYNTQAEYEQWLAHALREQQSHTPEGTGPAVAANPER